MKLVLAHTKFTFMSDKLYLASVWWLVQEVLEYGRWHCDSWVSSKWIFLKWSSISVKHKIHLDLLFGPFVVTFFIQPILFTSYFGILLKIMTGNMGQTSEKYNLWSAQIKLDIITYNSFFFVENGLLQWLPQEVSFSSEDVCRHWPGHMGQSL